MKKEINTQWETLTDLSATLRTSRKKIYEEVEQLSNMSNE